MIRFTAHAEAMLRERGIERAWVERVLTSPEWHEPDPNDPALKRAFGAISEAGGKILRVVYTASDTENRIVTVFFDARAKRPEGSRT
ncbi:MAG TPA: DUF4258 domain-containing protein [Rhizomicrobium sp.]|nr:DUF4258 domain-containing protein [Rhizomicrobium sp.]